MQRHLHPTGQEGRHRPAFSAPASGHVAVPGLSARDPLWFRFPQG